MASAISLGMFLFTIFLREEGVVEIAAKSSDSNDEEVSSNEVYFSFNGYSDASIDGNEMESFKSMGAKGMPSIGLATKEVMELYILIRQKLTWDALHQAFAKLTR